MAKQEYENYADRDTSEMTEEEAFAFQVKKLYDALRAEGFSSGWAGAFIKALFEGTAGSQ